MRSWKTLRLTLLALLMPAVLPAAAPLPYFGRTVVPLVYVTSFISGDYGYTWSRRQIYIFRDGTVLQVATHEMNDTWLPGSAYLWSGKASASPMLDLIATIGDAKAGTQADCYIDPPDAPLEWYFEFHWFGKAGRTNRFKATQSNTTGPPCPPEVEDLIGAVERVAGSAHQSRETTLVIPQALP